MIPNNINVVVTTGATIERIDPVRYISNFSSGKQGYEIAKAFAKQGCMVTLLIARHDCHINLKSRNLKVKKVESASDMLSACLELLPCDIFVSAAAICDFRIKEQSQHKIKKNNREEISLKFVKNPDILKTVSTNVKRPRLVVGFAAESKDLLVNAQDKFYKKNCDFLLANDISNNKVFGKSSNHVYFFSKKSTKWQDWEDLTKKQVANKLVKIILNGEYSENNKY